MNVTQEHRELASSVALTAVFAVIAVLVGIDLALDLRSGTTATRGTGC